MTLSLDIVEHDEFAQEVFDQAVVSGPALESMLTLAGDYTQHPRELLRSIFMLFHLSDPRLRAASDVAQVVRAQWPILNVLAGREETTQARLLTKHDAYFSAIATVAVCEAVFEMFEPAATEMLDGVLDEEGTDPEIEQRLAVPIGNAVRNVATEMNKEDQVFRAWGISGGQRTALPYEERAKYAKLLQRSQLTKFLDLLGRLRYLQVAERSHRALDARDESHGVDRSDRLPDAVTSELALLANPVTSIDVLSRYTDGQLLTNAYRGVEKLGRGPLIVCIDESGTMGLKDDNRVPRSVWAKAFALAMLDRARHDKRDFVGIVFSSANQVATFEFPAGVGSIEQIVDFATVSFGGGTDFQTPLDIAMDLIERGGKSRADIVFVTDDDARVRAPWLAAYKTRKAALGFRTYGIAVGLLKPGSTLESLSDDARAITDFVDTNNVADLMRRI